MRPHDLMEAARSETGLDDFGDDSFREGLERLRSIAARRGAAERDRRARAAAADHQAPLAAAADRGLVPAPPGDRRRADRRAADRARPAAHRVDGAVVPARRGPERAVAAAVGGGRSPCPPPSTVDGPDPRIAEAEAEAAMQEQLAPAPRGARAVERRPAPRSARTSWRSTSRRTTSRRSRTCPSYSDWLLDADLTSTYALRAPGAQAPAVGPADQAVAAEVPVAPAVARPPRPRSSPTLAS